MFRALVLHDSGQEATPAIETLRVDDLPEADTLLRVLFSSLNYKDALAVTRRGKIIRGTYPFIPGIDLVGSVESTRSKEFKSGDLVIGTGWGLGETHWGGYAEFQRVQSQWLVPLPDSLSPLHAMTVGTAGLTAMLGVLALQEQGVVADRATEVLVTGASGGVGSLGVALLARHDYNVIASTGKREADAYLRTLGAAEIISRDDVHSSVTGPLASGRWSGAVDVVGGRTLASVIASMRTHGAVAACGLTGGAELNTTVYPFILRGVSLLGIDSNTCPMNRRRMAWTRIAEKLASEDLDAMTTVIPLEEVPAWSERLLSGEARGRIVVALAA